MYRQSWKSKVQHRPKLGVYAAYRLPLYGVHGVQCRPKLGLYTAGRGDKQHSKIEAYTAKGHEHYHRIGVRHPK